jgi:hypothetical protein
MKIRKNLYTSGIKIISLLLLLLGNGCSTVFFDHPQPTDSRNLKNVPKSIRGTWKQFNRDGTRTFTIDKNSYHKIAIQNRVIPRSKADSSKKYKTADGRIYLESKDPVVSYPYILSNDSIYFKEIEEEEAIILSDSALLRSATNCWVLNLRRDSWWELVFIQKMKDGEIRISYPVSENLLSQKRQFNIEVLDSTRKDSIYFHADFRSRNIADVIPEGDDGVLYVLKPDSTFIEPK